ncbi:ParA family protein [uncultured Fusobacterium sp.]|uniref:ParA family protein n=1 Tax=uncultured Fusobacterium sp. TaxID=159267 RepID=UPI0025CBC5ED|nr:ParA family protein [uncultured Fusobacterium sp.]
MKKQINISLALKKDGKISQARLSLSKDLLEYIGISSEDRKINLIYKDKKIEFFKAILGFQDEVEKEGDKLKLLKVTKELAIQPYTKDESGVKKMYYNYKLFIPLPIISDLEITKDDRLVELDKIDNKIIIEKVEEKEQMETKEGIIIDVKNNKGGVGKTEIAKELGHGFALLGKKTLVISTDAQNNIIDDLYPEDFEVKNGLKEDVFYGRGETLRLRDNFFYLPLKEYKFSDKFLKAIPNYLEEKRKEYDVIIIDSPPLLEVDSVFVKCADKLVVPTYCDRKTIKGVLNLVNSDEEILDKIAAIVINRYEKTKVQEEWKEQLLFALEGTGIFCPIIPKLSFIEQMINNQKTVWEYSNKQITEVQETYLQLLHELLK